MYTKSYLLIVSKSVNDFTAPAKKGINAQRIHSQNATISLKYKLQISYKNSVPRQFIHDSFKYQMLWNEISIENAVRMLNLMQIYSTYMSDQQWNILQLTQPKQTEHLQINPSHDLIPFTIKTY